MSQYSVRTRSWAAATSAVGMTLSSPLGGEYGVSTALLCRPQRPGRNSLRPPSGNYSLYWPGSDGRREERLRDGGNYHILVSKSPICLDKGCILTYQKCIIIFKNNCTLKKKLKSSKSLGEGWESGLFWKNLKLKQHFFYLDKLLNSTT